MFADLGFAGRLVDWARDLLRTTLEIVRKPADQQGFVVHRCCWAVERTLAWPTAPPPRRRPRPPPPPHKTPPRDLGGHASRWATVAGMLSRRPSGPAIRQQRRTFNTPTDKMRALFKRRLEKARRWFPVSESFRSGGRDTPHFWLGSVVGWVDVVR